MSSLSAGAGVSSRQSSSNSTPRTGLMARATTPPIATSGVVVSARASPAAPAASIAGPDPPRPAPAAPQRRGAAERAERVGDEPVIAGAIAMPGDDEPLSLEIRRRDRSRAGQPVARADHDEPGLAAETHPAQLGRPELRRRDHRVETAVAQVAQQRAAVGLHDRQLHGRALAPEVTEERRSPGPAGAGDDTEADTADQPFPEVAPGGSRGLGRRQRRAGPLEEQLTGIGEVPAARVPFEELNAELGLQAPDLRRQARLGHPKALRGAREAALLGNRHEISKMPQL